MSSQNLLLHSKSTMGTVESREKLSKLYNEKGKLLFKEKRYQSAISQYESSLVNTTDSNLEINCLNNIGLCLYKMKNIEQAIPYFKHIIDIQFNSKAYYRLCNCYIELKRINDAITLLKPVYNQDKDLKKLYLSIYTPEWTEIPVQVIQDPPSDIDEAIDLAIKSKNSKNQVLPNPISPSKPINKTTADFKKITINPNDIPLAKSVSLLDSMLNDLCSRQDKLDYLNRYSLNQLKLVFKSGIEPHHIELLTEMLINSNHSMTLKDLKSINRFNLSAMMVSDYHKSLLK